MQRRIRAGRAASSTGCSTADELVVTNQREEVAIERVHVAVEDGFVGAHVRIAHPSTALTLRAYMAWGTGGCEAAVGLICLTGS